MDRTVYQDVISKAPHRQKQKISLFLEADGSNSDTEVPDPYWGDMNDFENVFQLLDDRCTAIAKHLTTEPTAIKHSK
jgi:protein-tyrosine phosphatase